MNQDYHKTEQTATTRGERAELREQLLGEKASRALAFQTVAVKHFGADGGIFIRQLLYRDGTGKEDDFWIYKSMAEWEEETGLQRRGQERARKRLIGAGVMEEKKATIHGRRTLHFRVEPWKLMEVLGDELPHAKPLTVGLDCTLNRTGSMSVNRTGSMSAPDRDHADSRQGITEDYSEDHSEEVSPLSPPRGANPEGKEKNGAGHGPDATSSPGALPTQPEEQAPRDGAKDRSPRRRSRSGSGTPEAGLDALRNYEHPRFGYNDLKGLVPLAQRHDFSDDDEPHWTIMKELGNDDRLLKRVRTVVRRAVGAAEDTSRPALHLTDQQTAQANLEDFDF